VYKYDVVRTYSAVVRVTGCTGTAGGYDETSDYEGYAIEGCDAAVMPVVGSSGEANASNYERLIKDGFLLTWKQPPATGMFTRRIVLL
jgi:hypothetical protein